MILPWWKPLSMKNGIYTLSSFIRTVEEFKKCYLKLMKNKSGKDFVTTSSAIKLNRVVSIIGVSASMRIEESLISTVQLRKNWKDKIIRSFGFRVFLFSMGDSLGKMKLVLRYFKKFIQILRKTDYKIQE